MLGTVEIEGGYMRIIAAIGLLAAVSSSAQVPQDHWFNSNGVRIRYVEQGSGEPVLLIHGYTRASNRTGSSPAYSKVLPRTIASLRLTCAAMGIANSRTTRAPTAAKPFKTQFGCRITSGFLGRIFVGYSLGAIITAKLLTTI